jgi:hypothetical protein
VANTTHYKLHENPDGSSGFTQVGADIPAGTTHYDHYVTLYRRFNASYLLQACNSAGCTDSPTVPVSGNLADAVGYFKASNTDGADAFGGAVALSADGNTLAVGAFGEDSSATVINGNQSDDAAAGSGAVYVFIHDAGTWIQQAYIKASNAEAGDAFGGSVALSSDGSTLAVGAAGEDSVATGVDGNAGDNTAPESGAVYVFARSGSAWSQQAYIKTLNTGAGDGFGAALAISADGNTLASGASGEDSVATGINGNAGDDTAPDSGALYVFTRAGGTWSQQAYVKASISAAGDRFGHALALAGDGSTLAAGARDEDGGVAGINGDQSDDLAPESGAVYVFTHAGGVWSQQAYVKASSPGAGDAFGSALALSTDGHTLAVGAPGEDSNATGSAGNEGDNTAPESGAVYVFLRAGASWAQQAYVKASNTESADAFGVSLSLSADGNTLAVGAHAEDSNANGVNGTETNDAASASGAAYVYARSAGAWLRKAYLKASNSNAGDNFGMSLALSSDGNTLAVGAPGEASNARGINGAPGNNAMPGSGAAYLF